MTDEELIKAMASGDRGAVADLYRRHGPWIAARLAGSTSSPELAEEALQDTFVVAWRSAAKYRGEGTVAAWLWGIARRRLVSLARREHHAVLRLWEPDLDTTELTASANDEAARVRQAATKLPPEQRRAIEAVFFDDRPIREVAAEEGVAEGTIKSRLFRARLRQRGPRCRRQRSGA
jgi:RNA polymerase sigma-70 factor (ECF subfamily)